MSDHDWPDPSPDSPGEQRWSAMTAPDVPRTTAGRALLETCRDTGFDAEGDTAWWRDRILAIEAEAAAGAPAEAGLREARLRAAMAEAMTATFGLASDGVSTALRRAFADHVVAALAAQEEGA